jgi:hypothetical protein
MPAGNGHGCNNDGAANRRRQRTAEGRLAHRIRQRAYRGRAGPGSRDGSGFRPDHIARGNAASPDEVDIEKPLEQHEPTVAQPRSLRHHLRRLPGEDSGGTGQHQSGIQKLSFFG